MANIRSARKKVRKDIKRTKRNTAYLEIINTALKAITKLKGKEATPDQVKKTVSLIDKAAKKKIIHKNKASRLKSRVMKLRAKKK